MTDIRGVGTGGVLNSALTRRGITIVLLLVVASIVVASFALKSIRHSAREHVAAMLSHTIDSTYGMMQFWEAEQRMQVENWAQAPELVSLASQLADSDHSQAALQRHPSQAKLRRLLAPEMRQHAYDGFFLIAPDHTSIASMRDMNLGETNPLSERYARPGSNNARQDILQRVFSGETVLSLPQPTDLPMSGESNAEATMFVVTPVRGPDGRIFAALSFRIKPENDFSRFAKMGRSGRSAEAYLLDATGRMLTGSRFEAELHRIGILQAGQSSILNFYLRDPGVNLMHQTGVPANYEASPLTLMATAVSQGKSGMNLEGYRDYRGVPVVGAWNWYPEKEYAVVAEIDVDEAYGLFDGMRTMLFVVLLAMIAVFMGMVFLMEGLNRSAGKALSVSEARYRQLFNLIPDAIAVHREGKIIYCNPAAVKMFGAVSGDDLIGYEVTGLVHPDDRQRIAGRIEQAGDSNGVDDMQEMRLLRLDGTPFTAEVEGCSFSDAEGVDAVLLVVRDISVRKLAEEERERLRVAVEQTPEGIMIADAQGVVVYANPGAAIITGRTQQELIGMLAAEARGGQVGDALFVEIVTSLKAGVSWYGEFSLIRPDDESRIIERRISPVMVNGKTLYHVSVDRDITDERHQKEHMEHTQRLESLGVLAGGIAHDFNNILSAILGNASMATKKLADRPDAAKHVLRIETAAQRAAELCSQMLAYSGKGMFVVKAINLSLMLKDIAKLLDVSVTKYAELDIDLLPDIPAVQADATQLQQVIMNLLINASDAIGENYGRISVCNGQITVKDGEFAQSYTGEVLAAGEYVYFEVSDTGCGMSEETRKKLFDPFYTTKFTGRGLGMSAVLGIVRGHHGAIVVDSVEGEGSRFRVLLPAFAGKKGEGVKKLEEDIDWCPTGSILVVDDEETVREMAVMMLEEIGFGTLSAEDGVQAIEAYREHHDEIALVLLDMTMPRMDGRTCFAKLREMNPDVRVVLSSGYSEQDATNSFADHELAGFVQKPYRLATLRAKLREVLEG